MDKDHKARHAALEANAKAKVLEAAAPTRDKDWFKRHVTIPSAPIFIASSEDVGTDRVRANHLDAAIHYFSEQECLKKIDAPIK